MHEDIDWLNASADLRLVELCRELAALARPVEKLASLTVARSRSNARRRALRPGTATTSPLARRVFGA